MIGYNASLNIVIYHTFKSIHAHYQDYQSFQLEVLKRTDDLRPWQNFITLDK